jgi:hypothetical protein
MRDSPESNEKIPQRSSEDLQIFELCSDIVLIRTKTIILPKLRTFKIRKLSKFYFVER